MDPSQSILVAEGTGFSLPEAAIEVRFDILVKDRVHLQARAIDLNGDMIVGADPEADAGIDVVGTAAKQLQHLTGMIAVDRFSQHLSVAFGHGVATEYGTHGRSLCDVFGFLERQASH